MNMTDSQREISTSEKALRSINITNNQRKISITDSQREISISEKILKNMTDVFFKRINLTAQKFQFSSHHLKLS